MKNRIVFGVMLLLAVSLGYALATRTLIGPDVLLMFAGMACGVVVGLLSRAHESA